MPIAARDSGNVLRQGKALKMRDAGNTLRTAAMITMRDAANVLRIVWQALSASVSREEVHGYVNSGLAVPVTTSIVTASGAGGTTPYSYSWARTDAFPDSWSIGNAVNPSTAFTANSVGPEEEQTATFVCTVTDATGATVATDTVTATARNISLL